MDSEKNIRKICDPSKGLCNPISCMWPVMVWYLTPGSGTTAVDRCVCYVDCSQLYVCMPLTSQMYMWQAVDRCLCVKETLDRCVCVYDRLDRHLCITETRQNAQCMDAYEFGVLGMSMLLISQCVYVYMSMISRTVFMPSFIFPNCSLFIVCKEYWIQYLFFFWLLGNLSSTKFVQYS